MDYLIYLVEDDVDLNVLLTSYLEKEGWIVTPFYNGEIARQEIRKQPHLWIIDLVLPGLDGYHLLKEIKAFCMDVPVIFISTRDTDLDRVIGLEFGSDDYLPKPFLARELVIRTHKLLGRVYERNKTGNAVHHPLIIPPYQIDFEARTVCTEVETILLSTREFDLLNLFISHRGKMLNREQIILQIWGDDFEGQDRAVDSLVRRLRNKMPYLPLQTSYRFGYKLDFSTLKVDSSR